MNSFIFANNNTDVFSDINGFDDEALVAVARSGEEWAFVELCRRNSQRVFKTIYRVTKNREDAEDAMQDSILRAFLHIREFDGRSTFATWFTRIGINSALMILRRKRNHAETSMDISVSDGEIWQQWQIADTSATPEENYAQVERETLLRRSIGRLPVTLRAVVEIRHREGISMEEIADTVGISTAATKARLARARARLRRSLR